MSKSQPASPLQSPQIAEFRISGLFGTLQYDIVFPKHELSSSEPRLLILQGPNGCGKTTLLRMISGILDLDFDIYRKVPFVPFN